MVVLTRKQQVTKSKPPQPQKTKGNENDVPLDFRTRRLPFSKGQCDDDSTVKCKVELDTVLARGEDEDTNNNGAIKKLDAPMFTSNSGLSLGNGLVISAEEQMNWITSKGKADTDVNYYHVLIAQRYSALLEIWQENDTIQKDNERISQENAILEKHVENIAQVKELLAETGLLDFE